MRKETEGNHVKVKALVTEVLETRFDTIYDGGFHRNLERELWAERQEMRRNLANHGYGRHTRFHREDMDMDDILPQSDYYVENTTKVRVSYTVDGQVYEGEAVLSDTCRAGKNIYLTIDPAHPDAILKASLYKSWSVVDDVLVCAMPVFIAAFCAVLLILTQRCQLW